MWTITVHSRSYSRANQVWLPAVVILDNYGSKTKSPGQKHHDKKKHIEISRHSLNYIFDIDCAIKDILKIKKGGDGINTQKNSLKAYFVPQFVLFVVFIYKE